MSATESNFTGKKVTRSSVRLLLVFAAVLQAPLLLLTSLNLYVDFEPVARLLLVLAAIVLFAVAAATKPWWKWAALAGAIAVLASRFVGGLFFSSFGIVSILAGLLSTVGAVLAVIALLRGWSAELTADQVTTPAGSAPLVQEDGSIAADWYADPNGLPSDRYWDGDAWTDQTRPMTAGVAHTSNVAAAAGKLTVDQDGNPVSPSSRLIALLLNLFLGILGIHRFYVGKTGTGVAMLLTFGGIGFWALVDFILILAGAFRDKSNRRVLNW